MGRALEAVEAGAVEGVGGGFKIEPVQLLDEGDGIVGSEVLPLLHELGGDVPHLVKVVRHGLGRELGGNDAVRNAPALLVVERREEGVVHGITDLDDGATDELSESLLIADLLGQIGTSDEDNGAAEDLDLEDLSMCLCELLEGGPSVARLDVKEVPHNGERLWLRDWRGHVFRRWRGSCRWVMFVYCAGTGGETRRRQSSSQRDGSRRGRTAMICNVLYAIHPIGSLHRKTNTRLIMTRSPRHKFANAQSVTWVLVSPTATNGGQVLSCAVQLGNNGKLILSGYQLQAKKV